MNAERRNGRTSSRMAFAGMVALLGTAAAFAQPELVVRIDGTEVATNFNHFFEDTAVGETRSVIVTLRNEGNETLEFSEDPPIQINGGFIDQFEVLQPALENGGTLSPNGSTAFRVDFIPDVAPANLFTHAYIYTNASAAPFHLVFRGASVAPAMVVTQADVEIADAGAFDFGAVTVGETVEVEFLIENLGGGALEFLDNPPAFLFGGLGEVVMEITRQPDAVVQPGGTTTLRVAFTPQAAQPYATQLFMNVSEVSDAVDGTYNIDLTGEGTAVEIIDTDGDGTPDDQDGCPDDADKIDPGVCGCGVSDLDSDGDGLLDCEDAFPDDPFNGEDPDDPNDVVVDPNDGNQDPNDVVFDPNEGNQDPNDVGFDPDDPFVPAPCGFGAGLASMMCMLSLAGQRYGRRSNR